MTRGEDVSQTRLEYLNSRILIRALYMSELHLPMIGPCQFRKKPCPFQGKFPDLPDFTPQDLPGTPC
jgi:hypothetical protein